MTVQRISAAVLLCCAACVPAVAQAPPAIAARPRDHGPRSLDGAKYHIGGVVGRRVDANVKQCCSRRAPQANPGMLAIFARRDRQRAPNWCRGPASSWASI